MLDNQNFTYEGLEEVALCDAEFLKYAKDLRDVVSFYPDKKGNIEKHYTFIDDLMSHFSTSHKMSVLYNAKIFNNTRQYNMRQLIGVNVDDPIKRKVIMYFSHNFGAMSLRMCHNNEKLALEILDYVKENYPFHSPPKKDNIVPIKIWRYGASGTRIDHSAIKASPLSEIESNYTKATFNEIRRIVDMKTPDDNGKIILWRGDPGTGKTTAIRSLAREWKKDLKIHIEIVMDPETLFSNVDYMTSILVRDNAKEYKKDYEAPIRLIILEDHAEIFSTNCRDRSGFSRFLNMTDGLLSAGSRVIFLLTANEELDAIDPAVKRAGRCLSINTFNKFSKDEAIEWLIAKGLDSEIAEMSVKDEDNISIADLYSILENRDSAEKIDTANNSSKSFGF